MSFPKVSYSKLLSDIRFWLIFFLIIRLYGITNPPLEVAHNWRQTTVTMVARNFYETDANLFYPRIDIAGEKSGITGMEFPFLNYLIYLMSVLFGYQHWYGRLINLIASTIGLYYFYLLVKKYFTDKTAWYATMLLTCSLWFCYSRKIMPDTFASSLIMISFYYGSNYLDQKASLKNLVLYFIFGLLGILSKIPTGFIFILFLPLLFRKEIISNTKYAFITASIILFIPVYYWYFIWEPFLISKYGFWHFFMGKDMLTGFRETINNMHRVLAMFYEEALKYTGFILFLLGLILSIIKKNRRLQLVFILSFLAFCIVIFKAGETFPRHSYYIIPFVPVMALLGGYTLDMIKKRTIAIIFLSVVCIEGIANQQHDFRIRKKEKPLLQLESELNKFSHKNDLIVINSGNYPTPMYFAHRKGWIASNEQISDSVFRQNIKNKGCKLVVIMKRSFGTDMKLSLPCLLDNENYSFYNLR